MAFFDEFSKRITDAGQSTLQKTKNLADTAKYSTLIMDEEKKIKNTYQIIGEKYFEIAKDNPIPELIDSINSVKEAQDRIEEYKNKIAEMKNEGKCPNCGAELSNTDMFCATCGQKVERKIVASAEGMCSNCGQPMNPGAMFCIHCGNKVETPCEESNSDLDQANEVIETETEITVETDNSSEEI